MAKAFFRWLRGELNGFYVTNINNALNESTKDIKDLLSEFKTLQFENGKISDKNLYGLGKFAGVFIPRLLRAESITSLRMTESFVVDEFECSERGLFNTDNEDFSFFHTKDDTTNYFVGVNQDAYNNDINTMASNLKRSSLVSNSDTVLGYISSEETDLFDATGNVKSEKILSSEEVLSSEVAYSEYYGDEYLMLSEGDNSVADNIVSIRMTDSNSIDDIEYSEQSLFLIPVSEFDDINLLATPGQRSSLVGTETLIGYISSEETDVLDDNGYVRPEKILATPPEGVAYSDYYGDQFMFLSEAEVSYLELAPSLYIELFKALQWIRYNGISIKSLGRITNIICPDGLVKLDKVETATDGKHWNVYYDYDDTVDVTLKLQRLNLLEFIINLKFIQVSLVENI